MAVSNRRLRTVLLEQFRFTGPVFSSWLHRGQQSGMEEFLVSINSDRLQIEQDVGMPLCSHKFFRIKTSRKL